MDHEHSVRGHGECAMVRPPMNSRRAAPPPAPTLKGGWILALFSLPGLVAAVVLTYHAWATNPGGRFHGADHIHWVELLKIAFGGFCFAGGLPLAIVLVVLALERLRRGGR